MADPKQAPKKPSIPELNVRQEGTNLFRLVNFELYARPTPFMRGLAAAGSGLFVGILAYFYMQEQKQPQQKRQTK